MKLETAIQTNKFSNEKHKAVINIMYTAYVVKSKISGILKGYDLTSEQFNVLRILKGKYPEQMCVRDIAGRMIEKSSNVPRIIDRLELKKLVNRNSSDSDKRETVVTLTQKGIDKLEVVNVVVDKVNAELCGLNSEEVQQLNDLLEKYRK